MALSHGDIASAITNIYREGARGHGGTLPFASSIYVPSTYKGNPIPEHVHRDITHAIADIMSRFFGGSTSVPGHGFWNDNEGKLVAEPVHIVTSGHKPQKYSDLLANLMTINAIAYGIGKAMGQYSVAVEHHTPYGRTMHFIETHDGVEHHPDNPHFAFQLPHGGGHDKSLHELSKIVADKVTGVLNKHGYGPAGSVRKNPQAGTTGETKTK